MIQNVIFDMGRVLQDFDPMHAIRPLVSNCHDQELLRQVIFHSQEWASLDRGTIDFVQAESAWRTRLPQRLWQTLQQIIQTWHLFMPYYPEMIELVKELKSKGYALYLLSNASNRFFAYQDRCEAFALMDGIIISSDWKVVKPERRIYEILLNNFHLNSEECFFIDDVAANIEAARQIGMMGFVYQGDVSALRAKMRSLNIPV